MIALLLTVGGVSFVAAYVTESIAARLDHVNERVS